MRNNAHRMRALPVSSE